MYKIPFSLIVLLVVISPALAQSTNIPLDDNQYHLIDRYELLYGKFSPTFHSVIKPIKRSEAAAFIDSLYTDSNYLEHLSLTDKYNLQNFANDNWEWSVNDDADSKNPLWNTFYRKKSDFYHVDIKDFNLHVNPVIYFSGGKESQSDVTTYTNTRGVQLRGRIAKKLGFYTFLSTTQANYPEYVRESISKNGVVPGAGFWKQFKTNGVDYFTAKGYISFALIDKYVDAQFGFDQSFTGNGARSLILSDVAPGYTFLKINTKIWRFQYTNLFTQLTADQAYNASGSISMDYPNKFMATHHLSLNITDNLNFGLFETIISGDSTNNSFKVAYLNPVIFYRALEHQDGSSDNIMVGTDLQWIITKGLSVYGQLVLDEFFLKEIKAGDGWWANKFGGQVGLKYVNTFGIDNLDLQLEYNIARPYFYAHQNVYTNYAHYRQPLGHALGANFRETIAKIYYQPVNKLTLSGQVNIASYGDDEANTNWGKDVMKSYTTREQDYNNTIGQGIDTKLFYGNLTASYQLNHNLFFDLSLISRKIDSELDERDTNTFYYSAGMRLNIGRTIHDF